MQISLVGKLQVQEQRNCIPPKKVSGGPRISSCVNWWKSSPVKSQPKSTERSAIFFKWKIAHTYTKWRTHRDRKQYNQRNKINLHKDLWITWQIIQGNCLKGDQWSTREHRWTTKQNHENTWAKREYRWRDKKYKKEPKGVLELNNTITKLKSSHEGFDNRFDQAEEKNQQTLFSW